VVQIEALKSAGVDEVVLAINYQPEVLEDRNLYFSAVLGAL
jgi:NDP-sugar pyrophosphorylase family protein